MLKFLIFDELLWFLCRQSTHNIPLSSRLLMHNGLDLIEKRGLHIAAKAAVPFIFFDWG
jgi:hypothetical protein